MRRDPQVLVDAPGQVAQVAVEDRILLVGDPFEQIAVVGDHDEGSGPGVEQILGGREHVDVHIVGGLVATRPMSIELRRESRGDVGAKREGLAVEWQSGDELFDAVVYVSSPTTDPEVLSAVLGAEVRRGALTLVELGFQSVRIDEDGDVVARLTEFARPDAEPERGRQAVEAFADIVANLPAVTHSGRVRPPPPFARATRVLRAVGLVGWALNVGYVGLVTMALRAALPPHRGDLHSATDIGAAVAVGIVAGLVASSIYSGMVRERVRGTSDAPDVVFNAGLAAFGGVSVLVTTLGLTLAALWNVLTDVAK